MSHAQSRFFLFLLASCLIFSVWALHAKTERYVDASGPPPFNSIVLSAKGQAVKPFVYRRLVPDAATLLAAAVPRAFWNRLTSALEPGPSPSGRLGQFLHGYLKWKTQDVPLLLCAHLLIFLSTIGFMYTLVGLASTQYDMTEGFKTFLGLAFGFALLGGLGEWEAYCYDIPNLCLLTAALWAIAANRPGWYWLLLPAAFYSKETSLLLIFAWGIAHVGQRRQARFWAQLGAQAALYAAVRALIYWRFAGAQPWGFWYLGRNSGMILRAVYRLDWLWIALGVIVAGMYRIHTRLPQLLVRWLLLAPLLVVPAIGMGWFEERRQYMEVLPVVGLLFTQWAVTVLGREHLFRARQTAVLPSQCVAADPSADRGFLSPIMTG